MRCRRQLLHLALGSALLPVPGCGAAQLANAPKFGNCTDCLGELNGALNACPLDSPSCQSCQNDDEEHFVPPWAYNSSKADAVQRLISISTGGPLMF